MLFIKAKNNGEKLQEHMKIFTLSSFLIDLFLSFSRKHSGLTIHSLSPKPNWEVNFPFNWKILAELKTPKTRIHPSLLPKCILSSFKTNLDHLT